MARKILIIESTHFIMELICENLKAIPEIFLSTATSADEALSLLQKETFELLILNQNLVDMRGTDLLTRFDRAGVEFQVILISSSPERLKGYEDPRIKSILSFPIAFDELLKAVRTILKI
jgi:DNA-binding NtrC family response regulator